MGYRDFSSITIKGRYNFFENGVSYTHLLVRHIRFHMPTTAVDDSRPSRGSVDESFLRTTTTISPYRWRVDKYPEAIGHKDPSISGRRASIIWRGITRVAPVARSPRDVRFALALFRPSVRCCSQIVRSRIHFPTLPLNSRCCLILFRASDPPSRRAKRQDRVARATRDFASGNSVFNRPRLFNNAITKPRFEFGLTSK